MRVVLFELSSGGHQAFYLWHLAKSWSDRKLGGQLDIVVSTEFTGAHDGFLTSVNSLPGDVNVHVVQRHSAANAKGRRGLIASDVEHGRQLRKVVRKLRPDHLVMMYFDHCQLSLGTDLRFDYDVRLSGIYFRPSFHYSQLGSGFKGLFDRVLAVRKYAVLRWALRNPHLHRLFILDPYAVPRVDRMAPGLAVALPDGIEISTGAAPVDLRSRWGVEAGRCVGVLFGVLSARKGLFVLLESLPAISPAIQRRLAIVLAGRAPNSESEEATRAIARARSGAEVQIIETGFVAEDETQSTIAAADFSLVPYQKHVGASHVVARSAAAGRPLIGSDYGVVGEHIRRHRLGAAVDTTAPAELAAAIELAVDNPMSLDFDPTTAKAFAESNTVERFCATIHGHLGFDATGADARLPRRGEPRP